MVAGYFVLRTVRNTLPVKYVTFNFQCFLIIILLVWRNLQIAKIGLINEPQLEMYISLLTILKGPVEDTHTPGAFATTFDDLDRELILRVWLEVVYMNVEISWVQWAMSAGSLLIVPDGIVTIVGYTLVASQWCVWPCDDDCVGW